MDGFFLRASEVFCFSPAFCGCWVTWYIPYIPFSTLLIIYFMAYLYIKKQKESWFERRLEGTLFERKIVGYALEVSQCPTLIRNVKTYC